MSFKTTKSENSTLPMKSAHPSGADNRRELKPLDVANDCVKQSSREKSARSLACKATRQARIEESRARSFKNTKCQINHIPPPHLPSPHLPP